jgi:hypothetical protein
MEPEDIQIIEQAFELLKQVEVTDENRRIIAQKYTELVDLMYSDDDETASPPIDPDAN